MNIKRALIVSVGTGTRPDVYIVKPLVKTIRDSRPDFLVLIVTNGSRIYGEAIAKELTLDESSCLMEIDCKALTLSASMSYLYDILACIHIIYIIMCM